MAASAEAVWKTAEYAEGPATIMAIGTANPPNIVDQDSFADFYFRITNSDHKHQLKEKFRRICQKSSIKKRRLVVSEEIVRKNPSICSFTESSFDARQAIVIEEIPKLAKEAAEKAIKEWGRPTSAITHMVFSSTSGLDIPGCDLRLAQLLGLPPSVQRLMLYNVGCHAGGTLLRVAKDIAENNKAARVLVVSSEITLLFFRGPYEEHFENLVGQGIFGDGAAALIVGADPVDGAERPLFEIASASQMMLPDSDDAVGGHLREVGLTFYLKNHLPALISGNITKPLAAAFEPLGVSDWNSLFWIVHPGGRAILDQVEAKLGLEPGKLAASRHVLGEYGNMMGSTVLFILDEMRQRSEAGRHATAGEGLEWGVLLGFGPGVSIETVVLHSVQI